jgi:hypothetical protein
VSVIVSVIVVPYESVSSVSSQEEEAAAAVAAVDCS